MRFGNSGNATGQAPFRSIALFVSDRTPSPRGGLLLIRRPVSLGKSGQGEYTNDELCFERVDGATTTFHVRAETPEVPVDWRFEWPAPIATAAEPVHLQHAH